jgi:Spy/CpxP family protein refolding chaperone
MRSFAVKSAVLAAGLFLSIGVSGVFGQDAPAAPGPGGPGARGGMRGGGRGGSAVVRAAKALDLTEEQKTKLDAIEKKAMEKMQEIRKESGQTTESMRSATPEERRASMEKLRPKMDEANKQVKSEIEGILTPEQKTKLEEKIKEMQSQGPGAGGRGGRGPDAGAAPAAKAPEAKAPEAK